MSKRRAEWEQTVNGATGDMIGFSHNSLFTVAGSMEEYEAASAAMLKPPHRWGEWVAVFHPKWDQIVGYVRLNPKDWYRLADDGTVEGPFDMKRRAWPGKTSKVAAGVYRVDEASMTIFTRDQAETLDLNPEEDLP
jgi:hypothetical protein